MPRWDPEQHEEAATVRALARELGVTTKTVYDWLNRGRTPRPHTAARLLDLARQAGVVR